MIDLSFLKDSKDLSLYIHIPYCTKKCDYCDFYSIACTEPNEQLDRFFINLINEIQYITKLYRKPFITVYIGGGNPGLLTPSQLDHLTSAIFFHGRPQECSIEMNPESITAERLRILKNRVSRLSIGVQSLKEENLKMLGRNSSREATLNGLHILDSFRDSFDLNIDLINNVPGQLPSDTLEDIDLIEQLLSPDHLSVYDLIVEEGTPLYSSILKDQSFEIDSNGNLDIETADISNFLKKYGYSKYEVSSYAKIGKQCVHNKHYWEMRPYIGIGPSAASTLFHPTGVIRMKCKNNVQSYSENRETFTNTLYTVEEVSANELLEEIFIMGIRTVKGVDLSYIERLFSCNMVSLIPDTLKRYKKQTDLEVVDDRFICATDTGMLKLNTILIDMFIELESIELSFLGGT